MTTETLEEQTSDFFWAANEIRQHRQTGGSFVGDESDTMSHALWMMLTIYRNTASEALKRKIHSFLTSELGMPCNLVKQLVVLAPSSAQASA